MNNQAGGFANPITEKYYSQPFWYRAYCRAVYAFSGFLYAGMACAHFGLSEDVQMRVGIIVAGVIGLFRIFIPEGFDNIRLHIKNLNDEAYEELREGNYDGVSKHLLPKKDRSDFTNIGRR